MTADTDTKTHDAQDETPLPSGGNRANAAKQDAFVSVLREVMSPEYREARVPGETPMSPRQALCYYLYQDPEGPRLNGNDTAEVMGMGHRDEAYTASMRARDKLGLQPPR